MLSHTVIRDTEVARKNEANTMVLRIGNLENFKKFAALSGYTLTETAEGCYKLEHQYRHSESYIEKAKVGWLGYKIPKKLHR